MVGGGLDHGAQVEEAVGDVHREHAVRLQVAEIEFEGLPGQQVDGHRVAGEGVDDQHVELLRFLAFELQAGVADDDVGPGLGVLEEAEVGGWSCR